MTAKLTIGFGFLLTLLVVGGLTTITVLQKARGENARIAESEVPVVEAAFATATNTLGMIAELRAFTSRMDPEYFAMAMQKYDAADAASETGRKLSETLHATELQTGFDTISPLLNSYNRAMQLTSASVARALEARAGLQSIPDSTTISEQLRQLQLVIFRSAAIRDTRSLSEASNQLRTFKASPTSQGEASFIAHLQQLISAQESLEATSVERLRVGEALIDQIDKVSSAATATATRSAESGIQRLRSLIGALIAGLVVVSVLGLLTAFYLGRTITVPLGESVEFAKVIATGDFSQSFKLDQQDEIGQLAQALNSTVGALRDQSAAVREGVNVLGASVSEIVTSTSQLSASAAETAASVSQTSATVQEVKQTSALSNEKAQQVSEASRDIVDSAHAGEKAAEAVVEGMNRIRTQMDAITQSIVALNEQSRAIGEIISNVDSVSEQSNILAVNAAIEAAKAGEHGRGFTVVAEEIRSLAERSKRATSAVRSLLGQIQDSTRTAVGTVQEGSRAVEAGLHQTNVARETIHTLLNGITDAADAATQIAAVSQQQVIGMDQVALAMESIKQASMQTADSMRQLETAAQSLNGLGGRLRDLVERFKL